MSRPDRPVLQSRRRNRSVLPAEAAQSRQNAHRKESGKPMNAAESRCPLLSFCGSGNGTEPSARIFAGKLGEMSIDEPLIDPRCYGWVIGVGRNFCKASTEFTSVALTKRVDQVPRL